MWSTFSNNSQINQVLTWSGMIFETDRPRYSQIQKLQYPGGNFFRRHLYWVFRTSIELRTTETPEQKDQSRNLQDEKFQRIPDTEVSGDEKSTKYHIINNKSIKSHGKNY
jgi:hypothetical protein